MFQQDDQFNDWQNKQTGSHPEALEEEDTSHRPPNAFILYSQAMRARARQSNPTISNIGISKILGDMWKNESNDVKLQYKQQAAKLQNEFKVNHPNYTYRKARRKRALNELLAKNNAGFSMYDPMVLMRMGLIPNAQMGYYPGIPGVPGATQLPGLVGVPQMSKINQTAYGSMDLSVSNGMI